MQPWGKHKEPQSYKRYGLKTSTSDEIRQGCLHFFTISQNAFAAPLTDKDHPQANSCKPVYDSKPVICNFCSHSVKQAWWLQTKWYGKLCRNVVQDADEVGTELFFCECRFFWFIQNSKRTHVWQFWLDVWHVKVFFFFLGTKKSLQLRNLPSRTSTLFLSRRSACPFLNCDQVSNRLTEFSGKLTFYTLCSRKVRWWKEIYVFRNVS